MRSLVRTAASPLVRMSANKLRPPSQLFSAASAGMNAHGAFAFPEFNGRNQQPLFGFGDKHKSVIDSLEEHQDSHVPYVDKPIRIGKTNIGSIILQPSLDMVSKLAIGTLITALLTNLIVNSDGITSIALSGKDAVTKIKNDTVDAITNYMIKTASEKIQTGDTTVIASIYKLVGRHISLDTRKKMLEKLVINGVSYGWLAEYDDMIDKWLTKGIEIKGGVLPSDKNIIDIVNIIQNQVLPVTNGIWYFKRAVKLRTGLGVTAADTAPDSYWYTSEGQAETAKGARETLAQDTTIAKIVVGLLSAAESLDSVNTLIKINKMIRKVMIRKLINIFKSHIASANVEKMKRPGKLDLILEEEEYPQSTIAKSNSNSKSSSNTFHAEINMQILELNKSINKCEKYLADYTKKNSFKSRTSLRRSNSARDAIRVKSPDSIRELRNFGLFSGMGGGRETRVIRRDSKSKSKISGSRTRSSKVMRRNRRRTLKQY